MLIVLVSDLLFVYTHHDKLGSMLYVLLIHWQFYKRMLDLLLSYTSDRTSRSL